MTIYPLLFAIMVSVVAFPEFFHLGVAAVNTVRVDHGSGPT
jgi:hypothetical protein